MIDLYLIVTSVFGVLSLLALFNLKLALLEPETRDLGKYERKRQKNKQDGKLQSQKDQNWRKGPSFKKSFFYLIRNFTIADFCFARRSRNKIPLLLSISIIAILSLLTNINYILPCIGLIVTLVFLIIQILIQTQQKNQLITTTTRQPDEKMQKDLNQSKPNKKLQIAYTTLSLLINLVILWLVYKNYNNSTLFLVMKKILISLSLDNLCIKPVLFCVLSLIVHKSETFSEFVDVDEQIGEILSGVRTLRSRQHTNMATLAPIFGQNQEGQIQIEPYVEFDIKDKYYPTTEILKSIKKSKKSQLSHKNQNEHHDNQRSFAGMLNSKYVKRIQPLVKEINDSKISQRSKENDEMKYSSSAHRKNKLYTQKSMESNQISSFLHQNDIQNQQENDLKNNPYKWDQIRQQHNSHKKVLINTKRLKTSAQKSVQSENSDQQNIDISFDNTNQNKENTLDIQLDKSCPSHTAGLFTSATKKLGRIHEDRIGQDLGQIDMNSPQRRKKQVINLNELINDEKMTSKSKDARKKYSLDPNQHSAGKSDLAALPSVLCTENQSKLSHNNKIFRRSSFQKSSQQIYSQKINLSNAFSNNSRISKSVKRTSRRNDPTVHQNDQNQIRQFVIEDFY